MPSPNDLDDMFFGRQGGIDPLMLERGLAKAEGLGEWPELYEPESAGRRAYLKLGRLIRSACEDYIAEHTRPGTLEALVGDFGARACIGALSHARALFTNEL